jgi:pimeloyl-ACP methyl ester carboxylesterase
VRLTASAAVVLLCLLLAGCAPDGRLRARDLAASGGFAPVRIDTPDYVLSGWLKPGQGEELAVYIEGDGRAWLNRREPSSDPTPDTPQGLLLAMADPTPGPVLYLGRPCQYVEGEDRRGCGPAVWTGARFSPAVLRSMDAAVTWAVRVAGTRTVAVYGYSGGGAVAALLAERRSDVRFLGTVAGVLDTDLWTRLCGDSPLSGSINPADAAAATRDIAQLHVIGAADAVVPAAVLDAWTARVPGARIRRVVLESVGHGGPFAARWGEMLLARRPAPCATPGRAPCPCQERRDTPSCQ